MKNNTIAVKCVLFGPLCILCLFRFRACLFKFPICQALILRYRIDIVSDRIGPALLIRLINIRPCHSAPFVLVNPPRRRTLSTVLMASRHASSNQEQCNTPKLGQKSTLDWHIYVKYIPHAWSDDKPLSLPLCETFITHIPLYAGMNERPSIVE